MEGPPLGPGAEDITWPDQVAPRGRKASSIRKIKPQISNLLWCWWAVWWLRAVLAPPPPVIYFGAGGPPVPPSAFPGLAHALVCIQCGVPGCCWWLRFARPCPGPMGCVGYLHVGLSAPSCRVRFWLCRLSGCAGRLRVALVYACPFASAVPVLTVRRRLVWTDRHRCCWACRGPVSAANPHLLRFLQIPPRLATFWSFSLLRRNRRPAAQSQDQTYIFLMCRI